MHAPVIGQHQGSAADQRAALGKKTHQAHGELGLVRLGDSSGGEGVGGDHVELEALVSGRDLNHARARVVGVLKNGSKKDGSVSIRVLETLRPNCYPRRVK